MATNSHLTGHNNPLSQLDEAINNLDIVREEMAVATVKATLDSASVLLHAVRTSMAKKASFVELALAYARLCEAVTQGVNRGQADPLSPSSLKVIEQLTKTAMDIYKYINDKQSKRKSLSRFFGGDNEKKMFDTWWPDLMKLSSIVNAEFGLSASATDSGTSRDNMNAQPIVLNTHPDSSKTETTVSKAPSDIASTHTTDHSAHHDAKKDDSNQAIHVKHDIPPVVNPLANPVIKERVEEIKRPAWMEDRDVQAARPNRPIQGLQYPFGLRNQTKEQTPSKLVDASNDEAMARALAESLGMPTMGGAGRTFPPAAPVHRPNNNNGRNQAVNNQNTGDSGLSGKVAELRQMVEGWTQQRLMRAAAGEDTSRDDRPYQAAKNYLTAMENVAKDGPTTDFDMLQLQNAQEECMATMDISLDDQMDRAIAESLAMSTVVEEEDEPIPDEALVRMDNRPVVVRTPDAKFAHVGQLWQALHYVPQIRYQVSKHRKPSPPEGVADVDLPSGDTEEQMCSVHDMFSFMETSGLGVISGEPSIDKFPQRPWAGISPSDDVADAYKDFSGRVEVCLNGGVAKQNPDWPRLFHSRIDNVVSGLREQTAFDQKNDISLLSIQYNDETGSNDLVGCLARQVFLKPSGRGSPSTDRATTGERAITELADVIAFAPTREVMPASEGGNGKSRERRPFSFPESLYLDQFLLPDQGRAQGAEDVEAAAPEAEQPRTGSPDSLASGPRREKYDLRAVLMHDGQKGRKHVYSYVNHDDAWWQIVDCAVTQVTLETVTNDTSGMYFDAGPFFLIYSRSLSEPLVCEWSEASEIPCIPNPAVSDCDSLYAN